MTTTRPATLSPHDYRHATCASNNRSPVFLSLSLPISFSLASPQSNAALSKSKKRMSQSEKEARPSRECVDHIIAASSSEAAHTI